MDGTWAVLIEPWKKIRTSAQNRTFHGYCHIIAKEIGEDIEYVKDKLKLAVFGVQERELNGNILRELRSSASLDTKEMAKLIEATEMLAANLNITLPFPLQGRDFR